MFDVGFFELVVIMLAIIVLFGPDRIPKFMQQVGRGVRQFRKAQEDLTQQIRDISAEAAIQDAMRADTKPAPIVVRAAEATARTTATLTEGNTEPMSSAGELDSSAIATEEDAPSTQSHTPES